MPKRASPESGKIARLRRAGALVSACLCAWLVSGAARAELSAELDVVLSNSLSDARTPRITHCPSGPRVLAVDDLGIARFETGAIGRGPFAGDRGPTNFNLQALSLGPHGGPFAYFDTSSREVRVGDACAPGPLVTDFVASIPTGETVPQTAAAVLPSGERVVLYRPIEVKTGEGPTMARVETAPGSGVFGPAINVALGSFSSSGREYSLAVNAAGVLVGIYCISTFEFIQVVSTDGGASWSTTVVNAAGNGNAAIAVDTATDGFLIAITPEQAKVDLHTINGSGFLLNGPSTVASGGFGDFDDVSIGGGVVDPLVAFRNQTGFYSFNAVGGPTRLIHDRVSSVVDSAIMFSGDGDDPRDVFVADTNGFDANWVVLNVPPDCSTENDLLFDDFDQTLSFNRAISGNLTIFGGPSSSNTSVRACRQGNREHFISANATTFPSATGRMEWGPDRSPILVQGGGVLELGIQDAMPGDGVRGGVAYRLGGANLSAAEVFEVQFLAINASVASSPRFASLNIVDTSGNYAEVDLTQQSADVYSASAAGIPPGLVDLSDVEVLFFEFDVIANSDAAVAIDVIRVPEPTSSLFVAWIVLGALLGLARRRSHRS